MLKHFTIPEYQKKTGASRSAIETMIKEGVLKHTRSEGGKVTYILVEENEDIISLKTEIQSLREMVETLMTHLGAGGNNEHTRAIRAARRT